MLSVAPLLALFHEFALFADAGSATWQTIGPRIVGFVIAALIAIWLGVFVADWSRRNRQSRRAVRQSSLFEQLCATHGLDGQVQLQLEQVAQRFAHGDVVLPFVDPRILETASRQTPELAAIGKKLFGDAWQP